MDKTYFPASVDGALELLRALGAMPRLVRHCEIVGDVSSLLSQSMIELGIQHDRVLVVVGAALHDTGKILHPEELDGPGHAHEAAGEILLLDHGVSPELARVCRTHGMCVSGMALEELLIAAADNVWKGTRNDRIETLVVEEITRRQHTDRWEAFLSVDPIFEHLAGGSIHRLSHAKE